MNDLFVTWDVSPVFFHIGSLGIRWYSLLLVSSLVVGFFWLRKMFRKEGVSENYLEQLTIYVFFGLLIGLRLGHCLFYEREYYLKHPLEIIFPFKIHGDFFDFSEWEFTGFQGLASHGGAIGILIALIFYCRKVKCSYIWILDRLVIVVAFGGLLVRMGNLMNSEIYGHQTTLPWGFIFVRDGETVPKHPTQLYEGISYLILSIVLYAYYKKKNGNPKPGIIFGAFLTFLFLLRFFIEFLKEVQVSFEETMSLNMGQLLSIPFILAGIIIGILAYKGKFKAVRPTAFKNQKKK